jgi:dCMP deaminase
VHAEANAIAQAARYGSGTEGASIYTTASPCYDCAKIIINAGIVAIYCKEFYSSRYGMSDEMEQLVKPAGVEMIFLQEKV